MIGEKGRIMKTKEEWENNYLQTIKEEIVQRKKIKIKRGIHHYSHQTVDA